MSFGRMTEFIDIIETVRVKDAEGFSGEPVEKVILSTRAYFEQQRGTKVWANRAAFSTATAMFTFRADPAVKITPSYSIRHRGELYRILSVRDTGGRGMYVEILADKISAVKGG